MFKKLIEDYKHQIDLMERADFSLLDGMEGFVILSLDEGITNEEFYKKYIISLYEKRNK